MLRLFFHLEVAIHDWAGGAIVHKLSCRIRWGILNIPAESWMQSGPPCRQYYCSISETRINFKLLTSMPQHFIFSVIHSNIICPWICKFRRATHATARLPVAQWHESHVHVNECKPRSWEGKVEYLKWLGRLAFKLLAKARLARPLRLAINDVWLGLAVLTGEAYIK